MKFEVCCHGSTADGMSGTLDVLPHEQGLRFEAPLDDLEMMVHHLNREVNHHHHPSPFGTHLTPNNATTPANRLPFSSSPLGSGSETPANWWERGMRAVMEFQGNERWHRICAVAQEMLKNHGAQEFYRWNCETDSLAREASRRCVAAWVELRDTREVCLKKELLQLQQCLLDLDRQLQRVESQVTRVSPSLAESLLQVRTAMRFMIQLEIDQRCRAYRNWREESRRIGESCRASWQHLHRLLGRQFLQELQALLAEYRELDQRLHHSLGPPLEEASGSLERCRLKWRSWLTHERSSAERSRLQMVDPAATDALHVLLNAQSAAMSPGQSRGGKSCCSTSAELEQVSAMETHLLHLLSLLKQPHHPAKPSAASKLHDNDVEDDADDDDNDNGKKNSGGLPKKPKDDPLEFDGLWDDDIVYQTEPEAPEKSRASELLSGEMACCSLKKRNKPARPPPPAGAVMLTQQPTHCTQAIASLEKWLQEIRGIQQELQSCQGRSGHLSTTGEELRRILQEETSQELCALTSRVSESRQKCYDQLCALWCQKQQRLDARHSAEQQRLEQQIEVARSKFNQFERMMTHYPSVPCGDGERAVNLMQIIHSFRHTFQLLVEKRQQFLHEEDYHVSSENLRDIISPEC